MRLWLQIPSVLAGGQKETAGIFGPKKNATARHAECIYDMYMQICIYKYIYICTHYTRIYFCYDDTVFLLKTTYTICQFRWTTLIQNLGEKGQNLLLSTPGRRFPCFFFAGLPHCSSQKIGPKLFQRLDKNNRK